MIKNFSIPNTKEDIYEFFILAVSNINAGGYAIDAWIVKMDQAYHKAELLFGKSPDFKSFKMLYKKTSKQTKIKSLFKSKTTRGILAFAVGTLIIVLGLFATNGFDKTFGMLAMVGIMPIIYAMSCFFF